MKRSISEAIFEYGSEAILLTDEQERIIDCNPAACRLFNASRQELLGRRWDEFVRDARSPDGSLTLETFDPAKHSPIEMRLLSFRGEQREVEASRTALDSGGSVIMLHDITARKQAEEIVQEGREFAESIVATVREPLVILDGNLRIVSVNRSFHRTFRVSEEETVGLPLYDLGNRQWDIPRLRELLENIIPANAYLENFEVEHDFPEIGPRTMLLNARKLSRQTEARQLILLAIEDITDRKQTEAALERSNQELEQFASIASHDLQEPLRKVLVFGDRLKARLGQSLDEQGLDYLERMQNAARRMHAMINDLLAFSRMATQGPEFTDVDLNQVAREAVRNLEMSLEQSQGRVELGSLPRIEADPAQMRQLLENLISNGLKFRRSEIPPVVHLSSRMVHPERRALCQIMVQDNGIGFDPKYLDRIFRTFQRLHGRDAYPGNGIGLAICRRIVERHGGSITAASEPGQGAIFTITLPIAQALTA